MPNGGSFAMGGFGGDMQEEETLFDLEGTNILYVTPQNTVTLTISVDERDVGKLFLGQTAEVTIEVLKGESFTAEVTEIGVSGTNEGGSSKYTVELTMDQRGDMLAGQTATATFTVRTVENVLVVPVAALVEQGSDTLVYMGKSGGELTKLVTVETGLSDGEYVEILSGLTEGQNYYYSYYDTVELSTKAK